MPGLWRGDAHRGLPRGPARCAFHPGAKAFKKPAYSPYAGRTFPTRPYFGDTHLHTAISLDAATVGAKIGPEFAYRFARNEEVTTSTSQQARLSRPLDLLVVSDHAEALGSMVEIIKGNPALLADPQVKKWHDMIQAGGDAAVKAAWDMIGAPSANTLPQVMTDPAFIRSVWEPYIVTADRFNEPGKFTAFIGCEWTSMPDGDNLHRNVIFRDGADKAVQALPFSAIDSVNVEDLWKVLAAYDTKYYELTLSPGDPMTTQERAYTSPLWYTPGL